MLFVVLFVLYTCILYNIRTLKCCNPWDWYKLNIHLNLLLHSNNIQTLQIVDICQQICVTRSRRVENCFRISWIFGIPISVLLLCWIKVAGINVIQASLFVLQNEAGHFFFFWQKRAFFLCGNWYFASKCPEAHISKSTLTVCLMLIFYQFHEHLLNIFLCTIWEQIPISCTTYLYIHISMNIFINQCIQCDSLSDFLYLISLYKQHILPAPKWGFEWMLASWHITGNFCLNMFFIWKQLDESSIWRELTQQK